MNDNKNNPNGKRKLDPYEREYIRKMNEYQRMARENFDEDENIEFMSAEDMYNEQDYEDNPQRQNGGKKNPQRQKNTYGSSGKRRTGSSGNRRTNKRSHQNSNKRQAANKSRSRSNTSPKRRNGMEEKKKRHPIRTFFKILIILLIVAFLAFNVLLVYYIGKVNRIDRGERTFTNATIKSDSVRNILVIGSDSRDPKDRGRTDTIILLSINKDTKKIIMTSFMRDMYVNINGKNDKGEQINTWEKINSAYVHGGAELLMDTIERNFNIAVDDYVYFGFDSFIDIVDAVGGIEVTITTEEAKGMQPQTMEINDIMKRKHTQDILHKGGTYNLNGYQALAYARLRYVGNADFQRTERQRAVINKIIDKVKSNPLSFNSFGNSAAENISTNMSKADMFLLFYKCLFSMNYEIEQLRLPADNDYTYGTHNGQSTLDVNFDSCQRMLRKKIYG